MTQPIADTVRKTMADVLGVDAAKITDAARSEDFAEWDSFRHLQLLLALEEEFGIHFDSAEMERLFSFVDLVRAVGAKAGGGA